jgi:hypothetical protein
MATIDRDDAFWLLSQVGEIASTLTSAEMARLEKITTDLNDQPFLVSDSVHVVLVPHNDEPVLAVRTNVEQAVAVAQIFNVDRDGTHAQVLTYVTSGVAKGTFVNVEAGR